MAYSLRVKEFTVPLVLCSLIIGGCENANYAARACDVNEPSEGEQNCSTANESIVQQPPEQFPTDYIEFDGVTGRVLANEYWVNADVCFDSNLNGQCDVGEAKTITYEGGKFSFSANAITGSIVNGSPLLALSRNPVDAPIALYAPTPLSATAKQSNITPYTTLVFSEFHYNPYTLASIQSAQESLASGDFSLANAEYLVGRDYLDSPELNTMEENIRTTDIVESLRQSQALAPTEHYNATAATLDAMYKTQNHKVLLSSEEVNTKNRLDNNTVATLSNSSIGWPLAHADEVSNTIYAQNTMAVIGSKWHNRLVVVDIAQATPLRLSSNLFAESPNGEKDGPIDGLTGATEQTMEEVIVTPDENNIMVAIRKYDKDKAELGVGLYRADARDKTDIPNKRFAADIGSDSFYAFPGLTDMGLSKDGSRIALSGEDKKAVILEASTFAEVQTFSFNSKARSIALNSNGSMAYVSLYVPKVGLMALNVDTGEEIGFFETGFEYPVNVKMLKANRAAWHLRDSKSLSIYNLDNFALSPTLLKTVASPQTIKYFDISPNEQFAIIAIGGGIINLYNLIDEVKLIKTFTTEKDSEGVNKPINGLSFSKSIDGNTSRALISVKNAIQVLDISSNPPSNWTEQQKQAWFDTNRTL